MKKQLEDRQTLLVSLGIFEVFPKRAKNIGNTLIFIGIFYTAGFTYRVQINQLGYYLYILRDLPIAPGQYLIYTNTALKLHSCSLNV